MLFKILLFAYLLHLNKYADGWSLVTSLPVEQPEPVIMTLEEYFDSQDTFRLNDEEMGLTAYKDKNFFSCFVNDLDPEWQPKQEDKALLMENQPCEKVNLNTDYKSLKKKAGPKIARMCRDLYIVWLAARNMGPPLLPGSVQQQNTLPCRVIRQNAQSGEENGKSGNVEANRPYDDATTSVSQQNTQPVEKDGAPPMLQDGAPPTSMLQDGAPPMEHNLKRGNIVADQSYDDGAPPMLQDGAPPMLQDGAPPMLQDGAPPMLQDGAPPMLQDGAPPMLQDGAPPMLRDGAPPMSGDGAPPMSSDGAPPMFKDGEMRPPLLQNTHSRRDLDALSMIKTPPPLNLLAAFTRAKVEEKIPTIAPFLKKLLRQIKVTNTVAPPSPDMKTPPPPPHFFRRNM